MRIASPGKLTPSDTPVQAALTSTASQYCGSVRHLFGGYLAVHGIQSTLYP
jgi:hypothetical protein